MRKILIIASLVFFALAALSGLAETLFYGGVDADGVLQESFFLPLSFILAFAGIVALAMSVFCKRRA